MIVSQTKGYGMSPGKNENFSEGRREEKGKQN